MLYESIVVFMLGVGGVAAHIPTFTAIATTATAIPAVKLDHPDIKQLRKKANVVTAVEAGKPANEQSWKKGDHVIYMEVFKPTTTLSTFTAATTTAAIILTTKARNYYDKYMLSLALGEERAVWQILFEHTNLPCQDA